MNHTDMTDLTAGQGREENPDAAAAEETTNLEKIRGGDRV